MALSSLSTQKVELHARPHKCWLLGCLAKGICYYILHTTEQATPK